MTRSAYPKRWAIGGALVAMIAAALFVGCGGGGGGGSSTTTPTTRSTSVTVVGMSFGSPITVQSGTVVTWSNQSGSPHNVIWDSRSPSTGPDPGGNIPNFDAGSNSQSWTAPTVTANTVYNYHCGIHGPMMSGQVTVTP